jgi:hypothetical protein
MNAFQILGGRSISRCVGKMSVELSRRKGVRPTLVPREKAWRTRRRQCLDM